MKRRICTFLSMLLISISVISMDEAAAADYSVGLYSYFVKWDPSWSSVYKEMEMDPMLLWGPLFSLTFFEKYSLSMVILQNFTNPSNSSFYISEAGSLGGDYRADIKTSINRTDLDLTLSYDILPGLKIFIGGKMMACNLSNGEFDDIEVSPATYTLEETVSDSVYHANGGAAGVSYTINAVENLYFIIGTSMIYLQDELNLTTLSEDEGTVSTETSSFYKYKSFGNNTTGTFSYYFPSIDTTLSLGGRFQVIKHLESGDSPTLANDYFYGVTLSVIYRI